jgi:hypothetical protein
LSIALLFLFIIISFFIVRVGAVALELTGLDRNKARFQSLSAFTGTGFTTRESEMITAHPQRRKIITMVMILGNAGIISVIATFILSLVSTRGVIMPSVTLLGIILFVLIFYIIVTRRGVQRILTQKIRENLISHMDLERVAVEEILHQAEGHGIAIVEMTPRNPLVGNSLATSGLREQGIMVLSIERAGAVVPAPQAQELIRSGDRLVCYGLLNNIRALSPDITEEKSDDEG